MARYKSIVFLTLEQSAAETVRLLRPILGRDVEINHGCYLGVKELSCIITLDEWMQYPNQLMALLLEHKQSAVLHQDELGRAYMCEAPMYVAGTHCFVGNVRQQPLAKFAFSPFPASYTIVGQTILFVI